MTRKEMCEKYLKERIATRRDDTLSEWRKTVNEDLSEDERRCLRKNAVTLEDRYKRYMVLGKCRHSTIFDVPSLTVLAKKHCNILDRAYNDHFNRLYFDKTRLMEIANRSLKDEFESFSVFDYNYGIENLLKANGFEILPTDYNRRSKQYKNDYYVHSMLHIKYNDRVIGFMHKAYYETRRVRKGVEHWLRSTNNTSDMFRITFLKEIDKPMREVANMRPEGELKGFVIISRILLAYAGVMIRYEPFPNSYLAEKYSELLKKKFDR